MNGELDTNATVDKFKLIDLFLRGYYEALNNCMVNGHIYSTTYKLLYNISPQLFHDYLKDKKLEMFITSTERISKSELSIIINSVINWSVFARFAKNMNIQTAFSIFYNQLQREISAESINITQVKSEDYEW